MFEKITKLKNFGIFRDFSWDKHTPNLAQFNLIYGCNRSGKTTLSKVFAACEKRTIDFDEYPSNGEFEIKVKEGENVSHKNCQNAAYPVRVFNRDFVKENLFFDLRGSRTNPVTYIGKEDIESASKLKNLQDTLASLTEKHNTTQNALERKKQEEEGFRTRIAKRIKDELGMHPSDSYRNYDKANLKERLAITGIENFCELLPEDKENKMTLIRSEPPESLKTLAEYSVDIQFKGKRLGGFLEISKEISELLTRSVVSETMGRLKNDDEINKWAEEGLRLHLEKDEEKKCLFCLNQLEANFLESLSRHFSEDYRNVQENIDSFIQSLNHLKQEKRPTENQDLIAELRDEYKNQVEKLNAVLKEMNDWIDETIIKLKEKRGNPLLNLELVHSPKEFGNLSNKVIQNLNSLISRHNHESQNHAQHISEAKKDIENHMIASAINEEHYEGIKSSLDSLVKEKEQVGNELKANQKEISHLEQKTSEIGEAVNEINQYLRDFFGSNEIELELDSSKKGYVIRRHGEDASNFSEGEKNAIAFSYFIIKTREKGFDIKESTIVIDDPISSFDSIFTYHCCLLLKNKFKNAKQLILLTHNFQVFTIVKKYWFSLKNRKFKNQNKKRNGQPPLFSCEYFMIRNGGVTDARRYALIKPLDKTLRNFNSEYHFLFSELSQFLEESGDDYTEFYRIGNVVRRFLETYANFKIPNSGDLSSKLDQLSKNCKGSIAGEISETEKDKLYRLINESSHVSDPAGAFEHEDRDEIKSAIRTLMRIVEGSDKRHYDSLLEETKLSRT